MIPGRAVHALALVDPGNQDLQKMLALVNEWVRVVVETVAAIAIWLSRRLWPVVRVRELLAWWRVEPLRGLRARLIGW